MLDEDGASASTRAALRARWAAIADSIGDSDESLGMDPSGGEDIAPLPVIIHPRSPRPPTDEMTPPPSWRDEPVPPPLDDASSPWRSEPVAGAVDTSALPQASWRADPAAPQVWNDSEPSAPLREPTLIIPDGPPPGADPIPTPFELSQPQHITQTTEPTPILSDGPGIGDDPASIGEADSGGLTAAAADGGAAVSPGREASPDASTLASSRRVTTSNYPVVSAGVERSTRIAAPATSGDNDAPTQPRTRSASTPPIAPARATTQDIWPISRPPATPVPADAEPTADLEPVVARANTIELSSMLSAEDRARYLAEVEPHDSVVVAERGPDEHWSKPMLLAELPDRDSRRDLRAAAVRA